MIAAIRALQAANEETIEHVRRATARWNDPATAPSEEEKNRLIRTWGRYINERSRAIRLIREAMENEE